MPRVNPIDFTEMTVVQMLALAEDAERKRQNACKYASASYLRKKARDMGMTIAEYVQTKDARGCRRKYFPDDHLPTEERVFARQRKK